jgi:diguanylate cyclase
MTMKSERHTRTFPYAKYAIAQIERLGLPADPESFELWYMYARRQNPALNKVIDDALSTPAGLTEREFEIICDLYLSSKRTGPRLNSVATDL